MVSNCKDTVRYVWTRQVEWMDKQHTRGLNSGSGGWFNPLWGGWRTGSIRFGAVRELARSALGGLENWLDPLWEVWKLVWSFKKNPVRTALSNLVLSVQINDPSKGIDLTSSPASCVLRSKRGWNFIRLPDASRIRRVLQSLLRWLRVFFVFVGNYFWGST